MNSVKKLIAKLGLDGFFRRFTGRYLVGQRFFMKHPPYASSQHQYITENIDPVRYSSIALAIRTILNDSISGDFAEAGVYRGDLSRFIHAIAPQKKFYLFDTFEGFPDGYADKGDERFKDTAIELVKKNIGNLDNIIFKQGIFPDTARGLEHERFAFVMLDLDTYKSTLAGLEFFYPRLNMGGYLFVHDYHSLESGVRPAVDEFLKSRPEKRIEIPDVLGSVVIRKI